MAGSGGQIHLDGHTMARYTKADVNVIALIGERGQEVVWNSWNADLGLEGMARFRSWLSQLLIVATFVRMRAAYAATAAAEYFRDKGHGRAFDDGFGYAFRHGCRKLAGRWRAANHRGLYAFCFRAPAQASGKGGTLRKGHDYGNLHRACRWR